ncbi:MAG: hypothetical protein RJA44_1280, partial [Pseudomonadota bacterium]
MSQTPSPAADSATDASIGEFFRYHGWLAPGIRLFRNISFPAKAGWVSIAFLIPLLMLLVFFWRSQTDQIEFTQKEHLGITYEQPLLDYLKVVQERRLRALTAPDSLGELQARATQAFAAVQARHADLSEFTSDQAEYNALRGAHESVMQSPVAATPDATLQQHTDLAKAVLALVSHVADTSQLTLDPEIDTFHMMNVGVMRGPIAAEYLSEQAAIGVLMLQTREITTERRDLLIGAEALFDSHDAEGESSYQEVVRQRPELASHVDMKGTDEAAIALRTLLKQQVHVSQPSAAPNELVNAATTALDKASRLNAQMRVELDQALAERVRRLQHTLRLQLGLSLGFVLLAAYLMLAFYHVNMGGLQEVTGHLRQITEGNLTTAPQPWGSDEAAQLMLTMREMQMSLRRMVMQVRQSSDEIVHTSSEIASGAMDLSGRTEQAAANLQESAASMEEVASTVKNTAEHTTEASSMARHNAEVAAAGGQAMSEVAQTMEGIQKSSARIGEIIGTIDSIAFQTNILALNAAVEAARA